MTQFQTICLCMIVKNEAQVIRRCIDSVRPLITHWVIVDTGSTDGTQDIIRDYLKDLPGQLYERPWKNFAHNRSESLALARPLADYSLIIDADDALEIPDGFRLGPLLSDSYTMDIRDDPLVYPRVQLVSNRLQWYYRGVLHEFITADAPHSTGHLEIGMRRNHDGARRKDPIWFRRDAEVLEKGLEEEKDPFLRTRYTFYLAQSYRDGGEPQKALQRYLERAAQGEWEQEVYHSLYQAARLKEQLGHPDEDVLEAYETATRTLPARIEAAHWASRLCRVRGWYQRGYEIARRSLGKPLPGNAVFAEPWIYETGLLDEFAVNAYWCGRYEECLDACLKIMATGRLLGDDLKRIAGNARYAWDNLYQPGIAAADPDAQGHIASAPRRSSAAARALLRPRGRKVAVITPYRSEETAVLRQCHESVMSQGGDVTHFMVADGAPNPEVAAWNVRHAILPAAHRDHGNTARGLGSLLAEAEDFDFVAYLDAGNWFHEGHLASLLGLHAASGADVCCTMRTFHQIDGTELAGVSDADEMKELHVDTSCYLLSRSAFQVTDTWVRMPRKLAPIGDRIFLAALRERGLSMAFLKRPTVAYRSNYSFHYRAAGLVPPAGTREVEGSEESAWLATPDGIRETVRALGFYP